MLKCNDGSDYPEHYGVIREAGGWWRCSNWGVLCLGGDPGGFKMFWGGSGENGEELHQGIHLPVTNTRILDFGTETLAGDSLL